jgi:hypothetical protein
MQSYEFCSQLFIKYFNSLRRSESIESSALVLLVEIVGLYLIHFYPQNSRSKTATKQGLAFTTVPRLVSRIRLLDSESSTE